MQIDFFSKLILRDSLRKMSSIVVMDNSVVFVSSKFSKCDAATSAASSSELVLKRYCLICGSVNFGNKLCIVFTGFSFDDVHGSSVKSSKSLGLVYGSSVNCLSLTSVGSFSFSRSESLSSSRNDLWLEHTTCLVQIIS